MEWRCCFFVMRRVLQALMACDLLLGSWLDCLLLFIAPFNGKATEEN